MTELTQPNEHFEQQYWGDTTDPAHHNPEQYRYLVYAFNPYSRSSQPLVALYNQTAGEENNPKQKIELFNEPERLGEKLSLSMSLIDQKHLGTWGMAGLIVRAPAENIVATSTSDMGTLNSDTEALRLKAQQNPPIPADSLLEHSSPHFYNEVAGLVSTPSGKIELVGFFTKVDEVIKNELDPYLGSKMRLHAKRLGLPLVSLPESNPYKKEEVIEDNKIFAVHLGGKRYILNFSGHPEGNFTAILREQSSFMSPGELKMCIDFIKKEKPGFETKELEEAYKEKDRQRQLPIISYYEDGSVRLIEIKRGYKEAEERLSLASSGVARAVNVRDESRRMQQSLMGDGFAEEREIIFLPPNIVRELIEKALEFVKNDPAATQKINVFWEKVKDEVSNNFTLHSRSRNEESGFRRIDTGETTFPISSKVPNRLLPPTILRKGTDIMQIIKNVSEKKDKSKE